MTTRLEKEPQARPRTLTELMSLAAAMEDEAVIRYAQLADLMERRGEHGVAETFRTLLEEERAHVDEVARWSVELTGAPPQHVLTWELPPEIARSWDEVSESALLTPYRALGIAVINEERGFAFYAYLAANSTDTEVREAAERLAHEELHHAAMLRRERRRAYRREGLHLRSDRMSHHRAASFQEFVRQSCEMESRASALHTRIAHRLESLGDEKSAATIATVAAEEVAAARALETDAAMPEPPVGGIAMTEPETVAGLLRAGLAQVETLHDAYVDLADHSEDEQMLTAAQEAAARTIRNLGLIAARLHSLSI